MRTIVIIVVIVVLYMDDHITCMWNATLHRLATGRMKLVEEMTSSVRHLVNTDALIPVILRRYSGREGRVRTADEICLTIRCCKSSCVPNVQSSAVVGDCRGVIR